MAREKSLRLLPYPKKLTRRPGEFRLPADVYVVLQPHAATREVFGAERFVIEAEPLAGCDLHLVVGEGTDAGREIRVRYEEGIGAELAGEIREQAYRLSITPDGIEIFAGAAAGTFYAFQTLLQIIRETAYASRKSKGGKRKSLALPCVEIFDYPDFARRGVYHDTARGKVPTVDTLLQLIDDLGHLKYNEFQLYIENNFEFRRHPKMYDDTTPFTAEEILLLDAACRARHMDFVPSLTSLGHMEKILSRPAYRHLAEAEPAQLKAMGAPCWVDEPWSLAVSDPAAKRLLKEMYEEFVPNFSSGQFNICCDEAYDLGAVRSKALAEERGGTGQLYVDWIGYCEELARSHGKSIQMWGDIILKYPELISRLPEEVVLLEWGYEHDHKFEEHCATFAERLGESDSRTFYVAPGTSSWLTLSSRTKNAFGNIHSAAVAGLKHGAAGILVTDWGDYGHQQMLAVSLVPMAYGAAAGWNLGATPNPYASKGRGDVGEVLAAISVHFFEDASGRFASLAYDLGLTYERLGWQRFNASLDWWLLREKWDFANYVNRAPAAGLKATIAATEKILAQLERAQCDHPHAEVMLAEFRFTCREIVHTCRRTQLRQQWLAVDPAKRNPEEPTRRELKPKPLPAGFRSEMRAMGKEAAALKKEFAALWMSRNKRSRVEDVLAEFDRLIGEYKRFAK